MNRVIELQRVHTQIESLKDEFERLSVPIAMNMGMIYNLYDAFKMSLKCRCPDATPNDTSSRKKFLYAILYIFSPATLVGEVMRHKLRENVSRITGCSPSGVSRDYKTGVFFYATYKEFREDVDAITKDMLKLIGKESEI